MHSSTDSTLQIRLGNGDGTFQSAVTYSGPSNYLLKEGDFNGDGKVDIVLGRDDNQFLFISECKWHFQNRYTYDITSGDWRLK